ncbi:MAG: hypothetical protein DCF21_00065 [Leptolyngbya sp.]|uniref:Outer membrane protein beta-barrel domain-containing protein n=1 Tax=Shackletoniella antarctica TaxID=268115 RepID=A0A2W4YRE6_9CYAN|nr:MAG: hypothetical protein DCF17_01630 [Shackletoniella antarctica]PZV22488.1 MAG: hypothetical protein DCF21_00065 [Leptolyngbya sp.]
MKLNIARLPVLTPGAIALGIIALGATVGVAPKAQAQQPPDYYIGAGVRAGFNDPTSFVIDSKAKFLEIGSAATLSARPSVLFGNDTELRLPISVDIGISDGFYPYAGAGVAYNAEGSSRVDPLITGGIDIGVARNLVVDVNLNVLFKPGNTDTELTATINYAF